MREHRALKSYSPGGSLNTMALYGVQLRPASGIDCRTVLRVLDRAVSETAWFVVNILVPGVALLLFLWALPIILQLLPILLLVKLTSGKK